MPTRRGRKSAAQTPAPRSERIYGSKKNPKGTAASKSSAQKIVLSEKIISALSEKAKEYNEKHKNKVSLNTLKAVYRRGLGAYSSTHRPTITGGAPNTRNAWAMARVNKFLKKASGEKVKKAYVQDDDLLKMGKGGSTLLAPNGKPSNLTPEQYNLVRTDSFKKWFGDWENDPDNASKVVDENGEPLVVYHGTHNNFTQFKNDSVNYFSSNKEISKDYGSSLMQVFLSIKNPYNFQSGGYKDENGNVYYIQNDKLKINLLSEDEFYESKISGSQPDFNIVDITLVYVVDSLIKLRGFDGAVSDSSFEEIVAFHSEQVKLADGSNTTFDGNNPDIRYADGGEISIKNLISDLGDTKYYFVDKERGSLFIGFDIDDRNIAAQNVFNAVDKHSSFNKNEIIYYYDETNGDMVFEIKINQDTVDSSIPMKQINIENLTRLNFNDLREEEEYLYPNMMSSIFPKKRKGYIYTDENGIEVGRAYNVSFKDGGLTNRDLNQIKMTGFDDEVIICSNCLWSWKASESSPEEKYICHKCGHDNTPIMDKITMDVPLFIRLLEFAREDAKDDMQLHVVAENAINQGNKTLTMEDYEPIVFSKITSSKITESATDVVEIPTIEEEFSEGGVVIGKRHSESDEFGTGEKFLVESTGQVVELEGGEGVLCKESMQSKKLYNFDGKKMTGRQIASFLNHKYGGVEFADGGEVKDKHICGCRSTYYHGGELPSATLDYLKGGEAVVTVKTMESKDKYGFQGRNMTPRKILSHINEDAGGKKFDEGGIVDLTEHHMKNLNKLTKMVFFTEKILYF